MLRTMSAILVVFLTASLATVYACDYAQKPIKTDAQLLLNGGDTFSKTTCKDDSTCSTELDCKTDADCKVVKDNCCDCRHGGSQRAMNANSAENHLATLATKCADMVCAAVISNHKSCGMKAVCEEGQCQLK